MRSKLLSSLFIITTLPFLGQTSFAAGACNETFPSIQIRAGYPQFFGDLWHNNDAYPDGIDFSDATVFTNRYGQGTRPSFFLTNTLVSANYTVPGRSTMAILGSSRYDVPVPQAGSQRYTDALYVEYTTRYVNITPDGESPQITHVECQPYEITWCGDGQVDSNDGEQCDLGAQNGQAGSSCSPTCQPVEVTPPPVCGSLGATAPYPVRPANPLVVAQPPYTDLCAVGVPTNGATFPWLNNGTVWNNTITATWTCTSGTQAITCGAVGPTPPPVNGVCDSSVSGPQSSPLSNGSCTVGSVINFGSSQNGSTTNYSWSCTGSNGGSNASCNASYTLPVNPNPTCDSLTATPRSGTSPVTSTLSCATTDATTVSISCGNGQGIAGANGTCTYTNTTGAPVVYRAQCTVNGTITNSACTKDISVDPTLTNDTFDLQIKKYIGTTDAQPTNPVTSLRSGDTFSYFLYVVNVGPAANTGTTTVKDILPAGVEYTGSVNGNNFWSCATSGRTLTCTSTGPIPVGGLSPAIQVPVRITASTGSVTNISSVDNPNEINRCNADGTLPATDTASCTKDPLNSDPAVFTLTSPVDGFDLGVKKYVDNMSQDAQDNTNAIDKNKGADFSYQIVVTNYGPKTTSGTTTIKDVLPTDIELRSTPTGTGWTCTSLTGTLSCISTSVIASGATYPAITVPVRVATGATSAYITNRAVVHNPLEVGVCLTNNTMPAGNESQCIDPKNTDPAVIRIPGNLTGFDLFLKKYIGSDDAQTSPGGQRNTNDTFSYNIVVTNKGPQSTTGVTTVQDILPSGVVYNSTATGWTNGGWNCTYTSTGTVVRCTSSDIVASGASYSGTILIPVKVTAGANVTVANIAAVDNPNEIGRCNADGTLPATTTATCTRDTTNSDPAYFNVPGGSSGGGNTYYIPTCVNGINSCSSQVHSSLAACNSYNTGTTCYSFITDCNAANTLVCSGPGGCSGPYCYPTGICGDGVLGSSAGEECDLGNANSDAPDSLCSRQCKVQITTNPGANPIKGITMSIPGFTNILGSSTFLRKPFKENNIIVGHNSNVFTLADVVSLDIDTQLGGALLVPADREFCLKSTPGALAEKTLCQQIRAYNTPISLNGSQYVVINGGYVQEKLSDGTYQSRFLQGPNNDTVALLKGSDTTSVVYPGPTSTRLRDEFFGVGNIGSVSDVILFNKNPATEPTAAINLADFQVKISGVMVGGTSSTVNRSISHYFTPNSQLANILARYSSRVTTTSATTSSTNTTTTANINISSTLAPTNGLSISSVANLSPYTLNGNPNIFSIKGNVTIENCGTSGFVLSGVRTLIVDGHLTIKCNIGYGSNDTTSSWAFITKNGDIRVYNGLNTPNVGAVTNIAGVYVAIPGTSGGGNFTYDGAATTTAILRLDGSMYGNPTSLFGSRLYVRGTNAYDILTTGVILSYSNRALVNPPPLLSNFLNNYSVSRVVR